MPWLLLPPEHANCVTGLSVGVDGKLIKRALLMRGPAVPIWNNVFHITRVCEAQHSARNHLRFLLDSLGAAINGDQKHRLAG
jgi:hypothetical protein